MATAIIVGNGDFPRTAFPRYLAGSADYIVCCDGALATWIRVAPKIFGELRIPDVVIGDMDSLSPALRKRYADRVVHVEEQDFNDQTKALLHVLANFRDVDTIHFLGATGKREDHTIGNVSLLMEYAKALGPGRAPSGPDGNSSSPTSSDGLSSSHVDADSLSSIHVAADGLSSCMARALEPYRGRDISMDIVSDHSTIIAATDSCELAVGEGRKVSIISTDNSLKVKSEGLMWPTDDVVFDNLWKATLNRASEDVIRLRFNHPSALLVVLA